MSSRFTIRRSVTALALGAAAAASLVLAAPAASAAGPQAKTMRLLDQCDSRDVQRDLRRRPLHVQAGSVTVDRFTADLQRGGSGAWWINNRKETIDAGDSLHVVNEGGIVHTFTEVTTFGSGVVPPFNAGGGQRAHRRQAGRQPGRFRRHRPTGRAAGPARLDVVPAKGVHQYQCIFHPWMRTVVTVR